MLTPCVAPAPIANALGAVPQVTPLDPAQLNVKVLVAEPVLWTVKVSLYPDVFCERSAVTPPSGVTATPYDTIGTEKLPGSLAPDPDAVRVRVPVPAAPTL